MVFLQFNPLAVEALALKVCIQGLCLRVGVKAAVVKAAVVNAAVVKAAVVGHDSRHKVFVVKNLPHRGALGLPAFILFVPLKARHFDELLGVGHLRTRSRSQ